MKRNKILFAFMMCFALICQPSVTSYAAGAKKAGSSSGKAKKKVKKKRAPSTSSAAGTTGTEASAAKAGSDYSFSSFLPFGIGQFAQGKTIVGATLAASQAGMLFLYLDRKKQIDLSNSDAAATIAEVDASGAAADQETLDYLTANENYVTKTQQEANLALIGFVGLYAIGVIDAIFDPLGLRPTAMLSKEEESKWADEQKVKPRVGVFVLPSGNDGSNRSYGFSLMKSFN
jgi:hypothetical protein